MKFFSFLILFLTLFSCHKINNDKLKSLIDSKIVKKDSFTGIPHCPGPERKLNAPHYFKFIQSLPKFKNSPMINMNRKDQQKYFKKRITDHVIKHFKITQGHINLRGLQRIYSYFEINKSGHITNIKVRAPLPVYEKEFIRVLKLLPQFISGEHDGKIVSTSITLPIVFKVDE